MKSRFGYAPTLTKDQATSLMGSVLESSTVYPIIGLDSGGGISYWNEGAVRVYGFPAEDMAGKSHFERLFCADDVVAGLPIQILESCREDGKWQGSINQLRLDGAEFTAQLTITPQRSDGDITGYNVIARDVTDELRRTREMRESSALMANVLEGSTLYSMIAKDLDGQITLWNEGARRLYGYTADEVVGKASSDILHTPEDVAKGRPREILRAATKEGKWEGTIERVRKDGTHFTARVVVTPRKDDQGNVIGYLLISKDVSDEIRHSSQVYEATALMSSVLEASTLYSIISLDLDGRIMLWNEGARRIYGYSGEELVDKANSDILYTPEDVAAGRPREILRAAASEGKWEGTIDRVRKDGTHFTARVVVTPRRDERGAVVGFLLISKDISDEIRLTKQVQASQYYTRSLIESNIDALVTTDPVGMITDVNRQMELLTGCSRTELIGSPFKNYFSDPTRAEEGVRLVLREERVTNYELVALAKDGHQTLVSFNASVFRDESGKLQGMFAAARDITEQRALERKTRESEAYNRGLIEASVDGLITVDPDGVISDVNETMCRMSDYPRQELIGTPFAEYFLEPERATLGVGQTFEKGIVKDYVLTLVTRSSRQLLVSFNASVFRDPSGPVKGIFASARDITEQARLQEQLDRERDYNRGLIEASLDGLVTVDPMLEITDVNETMCRMTGYSRNELIGSLFQDYFMDSRRAADGVRLTLDKGAVENYELTLRHKDGSERLVSFNAAIFRDRDRSVRGIFASARDITEQKRLQTQVAEERAYSRGLIEASVDGLVTVDHDMTITDVNDTMCRMVGRQRLQLIGSSFPSYFQERSRAEEGVKMTFSRGSVTNYVLTLESADGRSTPVSFNAAIFRDTAGEMRGIFASARDITAQTQLEGQLQASQFYTRSLIESNIDALMTTGPLGIITDVNRQMELLTGYSREELIGTPFKTYFTDPQRAEDGIKLVLHQGRVTNYELTARAKDGRNTVVSYNAVTFHDAEGNLQGVFAAARDITEQKKLEEQLRDQQTYLRGLIESSVDGLVTVEPAGIISDVNDRLCQMTGYSRSELIGSPFADYFTDPDRARAGVLQTLEYGVVTEYALTLVARSRRQLQVSFNASVFRDPSGKIHGIFASARDVADRVRLEEQLREQQTYLRGLIESSVDGLVTVDPEGFITDVNEEFCRMNGTTREDLVGSLFKQYFTEPGRADLGVRRTLADGVVTNYTLTLKPRTGRRATVSFNASVFRAADGIVQGIFASARDISEQASLQTKLAEQQAYNRSLIESSADALFAIAPDGIITDVNEEATRLTGYSRKHLINSRFADHFTEPGQAGEGVRLTFAESRVMGYELVLITRLGRRIAVSFNAGVFSDAGGTAMGILAAARDNSAQKALERQLRDSQFYTRSLIESNIDALMTTDPIGIISDVNEQMEALTGYNRDELIGTPFKQFFTDPVRAEEGIKLVLREATVRNFELTARNKDGRETVVSYNAATFYDQAGKLQGVFAAARDVTERKRFEQALQEKNLELQQANQAKDRFLASMSHELRTPLNAIIGFTGTLLMELPGPLLDDQRSQLRAVQTSGRHLLALINDLLDLAKIESGKVELHLEPLECGALLSEVAGTLRPAAEAKNLGFELDLPDKPIRTRSDRRSLSQILINLINNGIKFTDRGAVLVGIGHRTYNGRPYVEFRISDTGVGIRKEDQTKLFEAFHQLADPKAPRQEGTGLGLHVSQKLANLLGGHITLDSTYGKGSTFFLLIPEEH